MKRLKKIFLLFTVPAVLAAPNFPAGAAARPAVSGHVSERMAGSSAIPFVRSVSFVTTVHTVSDADPVAGTDSGSLIYGFPISGSACNTAGAFVGETASAGRFVFETVSAGLTVPAAYEYGVPGIPDAAAGWFPGGKKNPGRPQSVDKTVLSVRPVPPVFPDTAVLVVPQNTRLGPDGPYLLYTPAGLRVVWVDCRGKLVDTLLGTVVFPGSGTMPGIVPEDAPATEARVSVGKEIRKKEDRDTFSFNVLNDGQTRRFRVKLHSFAREEARQEAKGKIFVVSDPHSDLESFISVLVRGGVIDRELNWTYGDNRLMILGDVADRGTDAVPIYWLIYKLEAEAAREGGKVSFLYGNHEGMVLQNNYKYTNKKYTRLADTLGIRWADLMGPDSELGRWLATKNTIQIIGNTLFVHAGISPELAASGLSVREVNRLVSENIRLDKKQREDAPGQVRFLLGSDGSLWYRGLVSNQEKYRPVTPQELDNILQHFNVERIVVGHTTFDGVMFHHGGKVVSVDSSNKDRGRSHLAQGIELEDGKIKVID